MRPSAPSVFRGALSQFWDRSIKQFEALVTSFLFNILSVTPDGSKTIVLSEGADPRVAEAAVAASQAGIAKIICIGDAADVRAALNAAGDTGHVQVIDPATSDALPRYADTYAQKRAKKGPGRR